MDDRHAPGTSLSPAAPPGLPLLAADDRERVEAYVGRATAAATQRAYRSDWRLFCAWCDERQYLALPASPATVAAYLTLLASEGHAPAGTRPAMPLSRATIDRRLAAIVFAHRAAGLEPPTRQPDAARLDAAMRAIRRARREAGTARKRPVDGDVLRDMLRACAGDDLRAHRDRALLAIGMAGALRRSELVAITIADLTEDARGLIVRIPVSKTDQEGRGQTIAIPAGPRLDPIGHYRAWLARSGIASGPLLRRLTPQGRLTARPMSAQGVALVVKAAAAAAGYPPEAFSGHSLRAGFLTEAGRQNANLFKMKEHSRHASLEMVAGYVRDHERFREHAGAGFL